MNSIELLVLSMALGTDLFSVAIPIGMNRVRWPVIFRAAVVFAIFHIIMILTGCYFGHRLGRAVEYFGAFPTNNWPVVLMENWAGILGAVILIILGGHMVRDQFDSRPDDKGDGHPLRGLTLLVLAGSVSIDALAAGFSMGMMEVDLVKLSTILGLVIFAMAVSGLTLGRRAGQLVGAKAEVVGGSVLILLGINALWRVLG